MVGLRGEAEEASLLLTSRDRIRVAANGLVLRGEDALLVEFGGGTPTAHFNFPGGGVEVGETLEAAVQREVLEETCLEVSIERLLLVVESIASRNTNTIRGERVPLNELRFLFLCRPADGSSDARLPDLPDPRQTGVRWIPLERLPSEPVLPQVSRELIAAVLDPGKHPLVVPNPHD